MKCKTAEVCIIDMRLDEDVTDRHPELVEQYTKWFAERAVEYEAGVNRG